MLQYPVPLPPLSISSSKRPQLDRRENSDHVHNGSLAHKHALYLNDKSRPLPHALPLRVSTALSPASTPSSTPPSTPSTPFLASKRSPLLSSPRQPPSPLPRSPLPLQSHLSVYDNGSKCSSIASVAVDVLAPGDLVGEGLSLQGETIVRVPISSSEPRVDYDEPAKEFEVVRMLGTGSYAVVYLVREVLSRSRSWSDEGYGSAVAGRMDLDDGYFGRSSMEYGREYAIKLLSKANLDEDALTAQLFEATIHQSLPAHPNIVTLHRTLKTPSFLLLLLEFVPGEDLFYFLEQARDHYDVDPTSFQDSATSSPDSSVSSHTPSSPSLLASLAPSQLLSRTRLRLIASMFSQMCEAVATCHEYSVFHRDIKPENFIVTDGWTTLSDGRRERKVVVKLTDFGLSTTDTDSADMDCGSAPYMSYECRNNLHPTYSPRAADVWSLGIVLINMLYHYNPWTDAAHGVCSSFEVYRQQSANFFIQRFAGMTQPVAEYLATNVFCILDGPKDDAKRVSARAFGAWIKDLPTLLGGPAAPGHTRTVSISSVQGHRLASIPHSRRPSLRCGTPNEMAASQRASRSMSRAPSLGPAFEVGAETSMLSTVPDQEIEEQEREPELEQEHDGDQERSSTHKRRKRGARKGKGTVAASVSPQDATLETLAEASQSLAREISRTSRSSNRFSVHSSIAPSPVMSSPSLPAAATSTSSRAPSVISKKSSKWKLSFGKSSGASLKASSEEMPPPPLPEPTGMKPMSATASNVTSLLMGLNAPPPKSAHHVEFEPMGQWTDRGRRHKGSSPYGAPNPSATWGPSSVYQSSTSVYSTASSNVDRRGPHTADQQSARAVSPVSKRGISPTSTRSGRPLASSANSVASSNWRSSMSSAGSSTSAFTRYSNGSQRSVATSATTVSSNSWRSNQSYGSKYSQENRPAGMPANIKPMNGTPWELSQMPRPLNSSPDSHKFGVPPVRRRAAKQTDSVLGTISERPYHKPFDGAASTTDLSRDSRERDVDRDGSSEGDHDSNSPRKVQKGQINALAKMLSALRR